MWGSQRACRGGRALCVKPRSVALGSVNESGGGRNDGRGTRTGGVDGPGSGRGCACGFSCRPSCRPSCPSVSSVHQACISDSVRFGWQGCSQNSCCEGARSRRQRGHGATDLALFATLLVGCYVLVCFHASSCTVLYFSQSRHSGSMILDPTDKQKTNRCTPKV